MQAYFHNIGRKLGLLAVAIPVSISACGTSAPSRHADRSVSGAWPSVGSRPEPLYRAKGHVLAVGSLPNDGRFTILVVRNHVTHEYQLVSYSEELKQLPGKRNEAVPGGGATGPWIGNPPSQTGMPLILQDSGSCGGGQSYALAYGLLHQRRDTVTASKGRRARVFKSAVIPARLHPDGALVYALLLPGRNDVKVRTPDGHVVSSQNEWGPKRSCR